jgi:fructokinase
VTSSASPSVAPEAPRVLVIGESLIDIVTDASGRMDEHVGGSPANVAMGIARLGHRVDFATCLGRDPRGERIAERLADQSVDLLEGSIGSDPTSTATATLDATGAAAYTFDLHWDLPPIAIPADTGHVHTGSIGTTEPPGGDRVIDALARARATATVSYDPNVRPAIMGSLDAVRERVEEIVPLADVVKASEDDLALLYAGQSPSQVMAHWGALGAALTVITLGADGVVFRVTGTGEEGAAPTTATGVVDTVGAGDSFMAGLVSGLLSSGLLGDPAARARLQGATLEAVRPAIERGLACSGITVGRAGAYAPSLDEL